MALLRNLLGTTPSGEDAPNVEDVFSTYLYDGTGSAQTITNGIDLAGEGGMAWIKPRGNYNHMLYDTERGALARMSTDNAYKEYSTSGGLTSFNSDGFSLGSWSDVNPNGANVASWTFRKRKRFFDVVTYTGNNTAGRTIAHDLGVAPGMIIVKNTTTSSTNWHVYHRGMDSTAPEGYALYLNTTGLRVDSNDYWDDTAPTTDSFTVSWTTNANNATYVAYIFAHDPVGEDDDGMIACGSYTGNGSTTGPVIDLGWEPQYILLKVSSHADNWMIYDTMRGWTADGGNAELRPHSSSSEASPLDFIALNSTGFQPVSSNGQFNGSGKTYIYMAIRAPMMKEPEAGSEVFAVDTLGSTGDGKTPGFRAGFPVDMAFFRDAPSAAYASIGSRLTGDNVMYTSGTDIEQNLGFSGDNNIGWYASGGTNSTRYSWMFKRAKGFTDVVAFDGVSGGSVVTHSLGVIPELVLIKARNTAGDWYVIHSDVTKELYLNYDLAAITVTGAALSSTTFTLRTGLSNPSNSYIAYLFATLDGVSKVGSYTGTGVVGSGTSLNIDCGFSNGARFVLIKRTDDVGGWYFWDTARGIVTGNDSTLRLDQSSAENTSYDAVDPYSAGFTINATGQDINNLNATYIFLAIA